MIYEYNVTTNKTSEHVYLGSERIARIDNSAPTFISLNWQDNVKPGTLLAGFYLFGLVGYVGVGLIFYRDRRKRYWKIGLIIFAVGAGSLVILDYKESQSLSNNDTVYFYHNDHLGTPVKMTNSTGNVVWSADYLPFGEVILNEDPDGDGKKVVNNFRFPGQYYDEETGLHYNMNRYYAPGIGRYPTPDLIGLAGGINLYSYVANNPVKLIDLNGLVISIPYNFWWNYNAQPPQTKPLKDDAYRLAVCMGDCIRKVFIVSGGSECTAEGTHVSGSAPGSKHCDNKAFDMWAPGMDQNKVFCCALKCKAKYIKDEGNVWHFQTVLGLEKSKGSLPDEEKCKCVK